MRLLGERKPKHISNLVSGITAAALLVAVVIGSSLRLADVLQPRLGDMIVFNPTDGIVVENHTRIAVAQVGKPAAATCLLAPGIMQHYGGSIIIEAATYGPSVSYRVHWAGQHTSSPTTDCGRSARLLLTADQLAALSFAAAGWGHALLPGQTKPGIGPRAR